MKYLLAFIAFNFIIIIHELGHYIVARMSGIKVLEFSLFIGPKIFSIKRGETQYSLRLIPLLAYVKMEGEEEASENERSFGKKRPLIRAAVIAAGPLVNLIAAVIILTIVFSISGFSTTKIGEIGPNSPATAIGLQKDDKIIAYDRKSVYQPIDLLSFVYVTKGKPTDIEILRGNKKIPLNITPKIIKAQTSYKLGFSAKQEPAQDSNVVDSVTSGSPGAKINLKSGDRLVKLNDVNVSSLDEIRAFLLNNKNNPVKVTVLRGGSLLSLGTTIPDTQKDPEQYDLGIALKMEKGGVLVALKQSVIYTYSVVRNVVYTVSWLVRGKVALGQLSGPVGIFTTITGVVAQKEPFSVILLNLLNITAILSIAIGASNLLPIPPADGSKLVFICIEGIRRKPLPIEKEASINVIGFFIMIGLMIFITFNDIVKLFTGG